MSTKVTEDEFRKYLGDSYRTFAAVAWESYQSNGRGCVYAMVDNTSPVAPGSNHPTYTNYIVEAVFDQFKAMINEKSINEIRKQVSEYDPMSSFVVVALFKSDQSQWISQVPVEGETLEQIYRTQFAHLDNHQIKSVDELDSDFLRDLPAE